MLTITKENADNQKTKIKLAHISFQGVLSNFRFLGFLFEVQFSKIPLPPSIMKFH